MRNTATVTATASATGVDWVRERCEPSKDGLEPDLSYLATALLLAQSSYLAAPDRDAGLRAAGQALFDCGVLPANRAALTGEIEIDLADVPSAS